MRKLVLFLALFVCICPAIAEAAPCYGTRMPERKKFFLGAGAYSLFNRYLEDGQGKVRSIQGFLLLSWGVFDWLSIDLKGGFGNIKQHSSDDETADYSIGFAGGYGFRLKFYDRKKIRMVFGFQHISVHPKHSYVSTAKQRAILDDWQVSLLASYDFKRVSTYLGSRWSRVDYIRWNLNQRKRVMSDLDRSMGLVLGCDLALNQKTWLNLEGQFFDAQALSVSLNYSF
ncbi:MAG: hypothetical protein NC923_03475 [Candidatus Omnitrophica bacterium]|nr:hypothetical protein [Candidatus Omnitrophota bacterium]